MKKVSIITVVRNAAKELDSTLSNIESLDYPATEIIVIDGCSTDGTSAVIEKHRDRIAYSISEPDKGLYDAMNKGIAAATGDYIWFINAGDRIYEKDVLTKIFAEKGGADKSMKVSPEESKHEYADVYFGETMIYSEDGKELGLRSKELPVALTWKSLKRGMVVCHQSFIVRRQIAPMYDLQYRYVADIDWVIKCLKAAKKVENTGMILSGFAEGGVSTQHRKASLRERWTVMTKHYGLCTTLLAHVGFVLEAPFKKRYR